MKTHMAVLLVLLIALLPGCTTKTTEQEIVYVPVVKEERVDFSGYWEGSLVIGVE